MADLLVWDAEGQIPETAYARLQSHPCFGLAAHSLSCSMLDLAAGSTAFDEIFKDVGRCVASMWATYLHFSGGLTLPRLKLVCLKSGVLSAGRARAVLLLLRHLQMLEPARERHRSTVVRYVPTARFIQAWRLYLGAALQAASFIEPEAQHLADHVGRPETFKTFARNLEKGYATASRVLDRRGPAFVRVFLHRHGGMQIVRLLLQSSPYEGCFPPHAVVLPPIAAIARQLRVSRAHVNRLLEDAESEGLIWREGEHKVMFSVAMQAAVRWMVSTQLMALLVCAAKYEMNDRELPGGAGPTELNADVHAPALSLTEGQQIA